VASQLSHAERLTFKKWDSRSVTGEAFGATSPSNRPVLNVRQREGWSLGGLVRAVGAAELSLVVRGQGRVGSEGVMISSVIQRASTASSPCADIC